MRAEYMSLYRRVSGPTDLPPAGTSWESPTCDFKSHADPTRFTEMAKDMAAFANGTGGVILIKAAESQGRLQRYLPMGSSEADAIRSAFQRAAKDHCNPSPSIGPESFPHEGGMIVAVNVDAYVGQPVGVKVAPQKQHPDDKFGPCFMFPVRVTDGTKFLSPESLGTLMLPEIRKAAILLDSLTPGQRSGMKVVWRTGPVGQAHVMADLASVDVVGLTFELIIGSASNPCSVRLPLDAFRVLDDDYSQSTPRKRLHINGSIEPAGPGKRLQWSPSY